MMPLEITAEVVEAIREHGRTAYPHECCGALLGRESVALETVPLPNTTDEGSRRRFLVRPDDYRAAERRAAERRLDLIGFYHSHPDHPARPSQYDLDHAWPVFSYVILSVRGGVPQEVTSWRLRDDRTTFDEEPLETTGVQST
jgi:proteasome lid subunit RPN8/RPN11